jgi:hypothetical protein
MCYWIGILTQRFLTLVWPSFMMRKTPTSTPELQEQRKLPFSLFPSMWSLSVILFFLFFCPPKDYALLTSWITCLLLTFATQPCLYRKIHSYMNYISTSIHASQTCLNMKYVLLTCYNYHMPQSLMYQTISSISS